MTCYTVNERSESEWPTKRIAAERHVRLSTARPICCPGPASSICHIIVECSSTYGSTCDDCSKDTSRSLQGVTDLLSSAEEIQVRKVILQSVLCAEVLSCVLPATMSFKCVLQGLYHREWHLYHREWHFVAGTIAQAFASLD